MCAPAKALERSNKDFGSGRLPTRQLATLLLGDDGFLQPLSIIVAEMLKGFACDETARSGARSAPWCLQSKRKACTRDDFE